MALRYLQSVAARRRDDEAVNRGLSWGKEVGSLLSGLAGAIKNAKQDAAANQLMTSQDISSQPGAGVTQSLGKLDDGGDSGGGGPQDLGSLPPDRTFTNPSSGNIEPLQGQGTDDFNLPASSRGGRTVGDLQDAVARARLADSWRLPDTSGPIASSGEGTVGSLIHTGGTAEMKMRSAAQEDALSAAYKKAQLAEILARTAGTGGFAKAPVDTEMRNARLAQIKAQTAGTSRQGSKRDQESDEPVSIGSEPVTSQKQLVKHFDGTYGNGTFNDVISSLSDPGTAPKEIKNEQGMTTAVTVGPEKNRITIPAGDAQAYVKQMNALRLKQGLPAFAVPGEDQSVGASADNPYVARTNLDVFSRAPGTWVRLPNGKLAQVPERKR